MGTRGFSEQPTAHPPQTVAQAPPGTIPVRGCRCKWCFHFQRFSAAGMRSVKVMANVFSAGFHLVAHLDLSGAFGLQ